MSIADELQFVLDWEADRIGSVSAGTLKAQIAAVRDLEFRRAKQRARKALVEPEISAEELKQMVAWAYSKLHHASYSKQDDALMLDRMKLLLEFGA